MEFKAMSNKISLRRTDINLFQFSNAYIALYGIFETENYDRVIIERTNEQIHYCNSL